LLVAPTFNVHGVVNDVTTVSIWQYVSVRSEQTTTDEPPIPAGQATFPAAGHPAGPITMTGSGGTVRAVTNVQTLKALADPIRLRLLSALMDDSGGELPVRTVKELATALGEPQTKLYRHMKQLEAVGLIRVVSSRLVSGIVEQRYQACQQDLMFGPGLTDDEKSSSDSEAAAAALLDHFRGGFFSARRQAQASAEPERLRDVLSVSEVSVSAARAAEIRRQLQQVLGELAISSDRNVPGDVKVGVLIGYYAYEPPSA
jgi:DNA-binding transcriptional ArsR family regulator